MVDEAEVRVEESKSGLVVGEEEPQGKSKCKFQICKLYWFCA